MPDLSLRMPAPGEARPMTEPLVPPHRPEGVPTKRVGITLDHPRYVRFRTFCADHGLSGDDVGVIAIDRLLSGR